jgi:hypothetical protein
VGRGQYRDPPRAATSLPTSYWPSATPLAQVTPAGTAKVVKEPSEPSKRLTPPSRLERGHQHRASRPVNDLRRDPRAPHLSPASSGSDHDHVRLMSQRLLENGLDRIEIRGEDQVERAPQLGDHNERAGSRVVTKARRGAANPRATDRRRSRRDWWTSSRSRRMKQRQDRSSQTTDGGATPSLWQCFMPSARFAPRAALGDGCVRAGGCPSRTDRRVIARVHPRRQQRHVRACPSSPTIPGCARRQGNPGHRATIVAETPAEAQLETDTPMTLSAEGALDGAKRDSPGGEARNHG